MKAWCIRWVDDRSPKWCATQRQASPPGKGETETVTLCGRHVTVDRSPRQREPSCEKCIELLSGSKPIVVSICTYDPNHTLARYLAQQAAVESGRMKELVDACGPEGPTQRALLGQKLLEEELLMVTHRDGDALCADCLMPIERVYAPIDCNTLEEALRAVTDDLDGAIERTRELRP